MYSFESFHYVINLDVVSSFMIFNDFDSIFIFGINKIIFLLKKKKCHYNVLIWWAEMENRRRGFSNIFLILCISLLKKD